MSLDLVALVLPGLDPWAAIGLIILSFFTSAVTAAFSLGGGMLLLSFMVMVLPPTVIVPVHGLCSSAPMPDAPWCSAVMPTGRSPSR